MEFNWDDFKSKYSNEQEARQGFAQLCETIMQRQYPDFIVKNSDTIKEYDKTEDKSLDRKCIIYLPKYFLDGVSNSRKGQIRKALNDNLPYMKANKIEQWFLLMPLKFSPEESNWWENWSLRIKQENAITPTAILSDDIVELVAKHGIDFKGLEKIAEQRAADEPVDFVFDDETPEATATDPIAETVVEHIVEPTVETVETIINEDNDTKTTTTTTTKTTTVTTVTTTEPAAPTPAPAAPEPEPVVVEAPKPDTKLLAAANAAAHQIVATASPEDGNRTIAITITDNDKKTDDKKTADDKKSASSAAPEESSTKKVREPNLNQLKMTYNFKQKFEELEAQKLALPKDGDNGGQRGIFDRRRDLSNVKNYLNDFVFGDLSNFKGKELVKKAQIYVTNEQYSRGLYIYEYAYAKKLVEKDIMDDYKKGVAEAEFKLNYKYHMIDGDLKFAKGDYINAHDAYERAVNTKEAFAEKIKGSMSYSLESDTYSPSIRDNEAETKLLEAKAEALLHINEYQEAVDNFKLATDEDPDNKELANRYKLAQKLLKWDNIYNNKWIGWLSPLWAPVHYLFVVNKHKDIQDLKIYKTIRRRSWIGLIIWLLIIGLIVALYFMKGRIGFVSSGTDDGAQTSAQAPTTPLDLCLYKGDRYMEMLSPATPHYIDSAIYAYHRALRYDNTDTIAKPRYNKAMIKKNEMVTEIQRNIREDSATYFLSMRRPTEGLRLFKYKYDPSDTSKRKFGFVDTLGNIVIPPFFDFNYMKMNGQGETFYNGRAKVCLVVAPGDTAYFYIDKRGNKIDE
ncbi:MAG: hypothetical protein II852_04210 [Bacteroidales bacterium]|nr:hypothetical protein [Bacteroidales bacterium]